MKFKEFFKRAGSEEADLREDYDRYKKWLVLDENALSGKLILDVGSFDSRFGEYVESKNPGSKVLRVDNRADEHPRIDLQAGAEHLPLKENSVDLIVAHASISNNSGEKVVASLKEFMRVVKPDGAIHVAPLVDSVQDYARHRFLLTKEFVDSLQREGLATYQLIPIQMLKERTPEKKYRDKVVYCLIIKKLTPLEK
jgi:SAM-dependent methyltransferase